MDTYKSLAFIGIAVFMIIYLLWFYYLAVMNLMGARNSGKLTSIGKFFGWPIFIVGYILDVLVNIFILSVILMELPKEITVTSRLSRHISYSTGYRLMVAIWFCTNLLDPFDPSGCHCHKE